MTSRWYEVLQLYQLPLSILQPFSIYSNHVISLKTTSPTILYPILSLLAPTYDPQLAEDVRYPPINRHFRKSPDPVTITRRDRARDRKQWVSGKWAIDKQWLWRSGGLYWIYRRRRPAVGDRLYRWIDTGRIIYVPTPLPFVYVIYTLSGGPRAPWTVTGRVRGTWNYRGRIKI